MAGSSPLLHSTPMSPLWDEAAVGGRWSEVCTRPKAAVQASSRCCGATSPKRTFEQVRSILLRSMTAMREGADFDQLRSNARYGLLTTRKSVLDL